MSLRCWLWYLLLDSSTSFCSRLLLEKQELNLFFHLDCPFDNLHFWFKLVYFYFCIMIYSIVDRFSCFHYFWYYYNQKQSSGSVLQKSCSYKFCKIDQKTSALDFRFQRSYRSTASNFIKDETPTQIFLVIFAKFLTTLFYRILRTAASA